MRFTYTDPAPADSQVAGNLKIHRFDSNGRPLVKIWRGKQSKPYAFFSFRSVERREEYIAEQISSDASSRAFKAKMKAEAADRQQSMRGQFEVGTLLHYSWGYDQTQCEFFQVVRRTGASAFIRRIAGEQTRATGPDACMMRPIPGKFVGREIRKVIGPYGLSMSHGSASPTTAGKEHYCSWYA